LRAKIWMVEINTLPVSSSRQCIQTVVFHTPNASNLCSWTSRQLQ
jgi:hypothetical protein